QSLRLTNSNRRNHRLQKSERLLFAQTFFRAPKMLGSIVPSSRFLIENVLRAVDWERTRMVVEYGPGTGIFTREILARLPGDGRLLAIEHNQDLYSHLRSTIRDRRLELFHGSAEDVNVAMHQAGAGPAHCIISGIPFSTIPEDSRGRIVKHSFTSLDTGGIFL